MRRRTKKDERIKELEAEIRAIKQREEYYENSKRWDEMIPWYDLTDAERAAAIEYWGPELGNR